MGHYMGLDAAGRLEDSPETHHIDFTQKDLFDIAQINHALHQQQMAEQNLEGAMQIEAFQPAPTAGTVPAQQDGRHLNYNLNDDMKNELGELITPLTGQRGFSPGKTLYIKPQLNRPRSAHERTAQGIVNRVIARARGDEQGPRQNQRAGAYNKYMLKQQKMVTLVEPKQRVERKHKDKQPKEQEQEKAKKQGAANGPGDGKSPVKPVENVHSPVPSMQEELCVDQLFAEFKNKDPPKNKWNRFPTGPIPVHKHVHKHRYAKCGNQRQGECHLLHGDSNEELAGIRACLKSREQIEEEAKQAALSVEGKALDGKSDQKSKTLSGRQASQKPSLDQQAMTIAHGYDRHISKLLDNYIQQTGPFQEPEYDEDQLYR